MLTWPQARHITIVPPLALHKLDSLYHTLQLPPQEREAVDAIYDLYRDWFLRHADPNEVFRDIALAIASMEQIERDF